MSRKIRKRRHSVFLTARIQDDRCQWMSGLQCWGLLKRKKKQKKQISKIKSISEKLERVERLKFFLTFLFYNCFCPHNVALNTPSRDQSWHIYTCNHFSDKSVWFMFLSALKTCQNISFWSIRFVRVHIHEWDLAGCISTADGIRGISDKQG